MIRAKKIFVASSTAETGGPELLHQLVDQLRNIGCDAYITYLPLDQTNKKPGRFEQYDAPVSAWEDHRDNYILLPENQTGLSLQIYNARSGIWWLSVDNYLGYKHQSVLKDVYVRFRRLGGIRAPLFKLKHADHFAQSEYARRFLEKRNIKASMLSDFLRSEFLELKFDPTIKENLIAFNPNKGQKQLERLQTQYPEFKFVPLKNMTPDEVAALLLRAKIYVDFGHHPGKDRPPREAAMAGCCVITGRKGSAGNPIDLPIPEQYKLSDRRQQYIRDFGPLAKDIFNHYDRHQHQFDTYRQTILNEHDLFIQQVANLFEPAHA